MNRGIGLVAYGDSDEDNSDEDSPMTIAPPAETRGINESESSSESQKAELSTNSIKKDSALERPTLQDTVSARSIINARPSGNESLKKLASTNLLKQGLAASTENNYNDLSTEAATEISNTHSFIRSQSGTPLPPDHSAAADVYNTPIGGRSPQVLSVDGVHIADESRVVGESEDDKDDGDSEVGSHKWHNNRIKLMKSLLRPKPIPGVENFGIPPSPESEVNPDVQAKMEQFHHVKVTRGIHFNQSLMKNKNFRNPHIYASLVEFVALNEIGSNFEKTEFFDFEGYGPESYATGIAESQKQASEKLAQQQTMARSQLQFVPGSTAVGGFPSVTPVVKPVIPRSQPTSTVGSSVSSGAQRNRKSKWDQASDDPNGKKPRHFD